MEEIKVERPVLTQESFNDVSEYVKPHENKFKSYLRSKWNSCSPGKFLKENIPILAWLSTYNWKNDLPCDIIAGVTIAIMQIPQGLAYALLANVPAAVGIYMAIFPVIPYIILGTSRHNSMGTFAVISLLVGRTVSTYSHNPLYMHPQRTINGTLEYVEYTELEVGTSVCLLVALWQLLMWALRLGAICALLSDVMVNSFTCGASFHILTSQIKSVVGISTKRYSGPLQLVYTYLELFQNIIHADEKRLNTVYTALTVSAICFIILMINIYVIKPRLAKITRIPFPCELVLVISGVLFSLQLSLTENLPTIGYIPKGIPQPVPPQIGLFPNLLVDSFITAIVSYATLMSMALILAKGENYEVDPNQELLAMGVGNAVGSCFSCIAFAASLSRSIVAKSVGGKSQLHAFISGILIVVTLLWIADFFEPLPRAVLAAIIIVALRSVLLQILDLPSFWKLSHADGVLWVCVFLSVVIIDIDYGLLIGFLLSAGRVFLQGMKAYTCVLGRVPNTDLYLDVKRYKAAREVNELKMIHYGGALNFATRHHLKEVVAELSGISPQKELKRLNRRLKHANDNKASNNDHNEIEEPTGKINHAFEGEHYYTEEKIKCIVLDVTAVTGLDPSGAEQLRILRDEYQEVEVGFIIAGCSGPVYECLRRCGLLTGEHALCLFPSVHDAARHAAKY